MNAKTGQQLWQASIPANSGQLVVDGQAAYTLTQQFDATGAPLSNVLTAWKSTNGQMLWQYQTLMALSVPTSDGKALCLEASAFLGPQMTHVLALNMTNGKQLWNMANDALDYGTGCALSDGLAFVATDLETEGVGPGLLALHRSDGSQQWKMPPNEG